MIMLKTEGKKLNSIVAVQECSEGVPSARPNQCQIEKLKLETKNIIAG
jgi:hypothetical protein